jgi:hypothetical protein
MYIDKFGFIPEHLDLLWSEGQIRTIVEPHEALRWVEQYANTDGYLYPPLMYWRRQDPKNPEGESEKIEGTERPALLHRLPATHELRLTRAPDEPGALRLREAGFVVHFLGFLHGRRCQFWDWWVDGRLLTSHHNDYILFQPEVTSICLERALGRWATWPPADQNVLINALFLHNRAPMYEWDWERFQAEYQVLDALYAVANRRYGVKASGHAKRIAALCDFFDLHRNVPLIEEMVRLRNDLTHEALWGKQMPTSAPQGTFQMPYWLHRLNQRLGLAVLGIDNDYVHTKWQSGGQFVFGVPILQ